MQNAYSTAKTIFAKPSLRPEIEIHSLDYDFPTALARPVVRTLNHAIGDTVIPKKPTTTQKASFPQAAITAPSYKTVSPPAARDSKPGAIANEKMATLSTKPTSRYTIETFIDAVKNGRLESVVLHIEAGLEVNVKSKRLGNTPLIVAARHGHETIVRHLLMAGAFVDQARDDDVTALMSAALFGHIAIVQALLDKDANSYLQSKGGNTALDYAIAENHKEVIELIKLRRAQAVLTNLLEQS